MSNPLTIDNVTFTWSEAYAPLIASSSVTLTIDNVTFTWSEEHNEWLAGPLCLGMDSNGYHAGFKTNFESLSVGAGDSFKNAVAAARLNPLFAAEFTRLQQSQQREQNESAVELLDQWKREDALPTPTELYEQKPERFDAWGLVWRRMKELDSSYSAQWGSGPLRLHCSDVNKAMIWSPRTGGVWCLALQSAYDAAVAAGVDFSGCERVGPLVPRTDAFDEVVVGVQKAPIVIDSIEFTWRPEHDCWATWPLMLDNHGNFWETSVFGAATSYSGLTPAEAVECARRIDDKYAEVFSRMKFVQEEGTRAVKSLTLPEDFTIIRNGHPVEFRLPPKLPSDSCPACDRPFIDPYVIRAGHSNSCVECTTTFSHRTPSRAFTVDTPPPRPDTLSAAAKWHLANTSHSGEKPGWEE